MTEVDILIKMEGAAAVDVSNGIETNATKSTIVAESNGVDKAANGINGNATNGAIVTTEEKKEAEPAEPPKDPAVDPIGWLQQQIPAAVHKVNYHILDWVQKSAIQDSAKHQALPGKNDSVTRNQLLVFLRDGKILAHLANKFAPNSVEVIHEDEAVKEKSNQISNIQAFITFAKEKVGLEENEVFTVEDLQEKGKAGYEAVVNTLFQIGLKAEEKFGQAGINIQQIAEDAATAVHTNILQTILNFFKRATTPSATDKAEAEKVVETSNGAVIIEPTTPTTITAEEIRKVDEPVAATPAAVN